MSWHFIPTTQWCPITLLHPMIVPPGRSSPTTAPLLNNLVQANNDIDVSVHYIDKGK